MNETVYAEADLPVLYMKQQETGKIEKWIHGDPNDIERILTESMTALIAEQPNMRRVLRRAVHRVRVNTMPDFVRYWLDGWPLTLIGVGLIYLVLYGLGFVLHWLGVL